MSRSWTRNQSLHAAVLRINHGKLVDTHCHCLPGVDDGPLTLDDSVELCQALVRDGIKTVVATPHQLGPWTNRLDGPTIREAVAQLNGELLQRGVEIEVLAGCEIRVEAGIAELLHEDRLMTLADQRAYVLLELPFDAYINLSPLLEQLLRIGIRGVIAHPERNAGILANPRLIRTWDAYQPRFQITATSLLGGFGKQAETVAWTLLEMPIRCVVATDAHSATARQPRLAAAFELLLDRLGPARARALCVEGPLELIGRLGQRIQDGSRAWSGL